ncbi:beta-lactamase [Leptospira fainei serovar Hurstbridge str. BUT 6]|uniref:Beta-lactamase n=1 Tax=Leptospira fainei serovar Hurstbridge str. BUT 6 TaxID=1193011 RepID=S3W593_9LEPT|nr:serine hydrolase domain-containing protein [Leptospira fainei]EPG75412.1 beta-lactamase [Leptospira fainei serovar Hurstbridge str. BUT 6]
MLNKVIIYILFFLFLSGCGIFVKNQHQTRGSKVQVYLEEQISQNNTPGIQYAVVKANSEIFRFNGGLADIASGRLISDKTTMMIYSMSKTITAIAVLQLAEQDKLSLEDPVTKYLPDIPYGNRLRIRHLLSQTSGIPNPLPLRWVHLEEEEGSFDEISNLRKILEKNPGLDFVPGQKYSYSNISYWLLGRVIEKVSGLEFKEYIRKNIFDRLHIPRNEAGFTINEQEAYSKGYLRRWSFINLFKKFLIDQKFIGEYEQNWLRIRDHYVDGPAFGGIICTINAIVSVLRDLLRENSKLIGSEMKHLLFKQQTNNKGEPIEMTLGWHIGKLDQVSFFYKEGGGAGFHSEMRIYPKFRIATVVLTNNGIFDTRSLLNTIDKEFLK